jgi:catecholate siderophore receptor
LVVDDHREESIVHAEPPAAATASAATIVASATAPSPDPPRDDDGDEVVGSPDKLQEVTVTGVRPLLHTKLADDQQHTPQSVTVVSQQLLESQAATRLTDALRNVPGITLNSGEGAARGDTVNLRGFAAFNDFFLDGIRDAAVYTRDSFDLQSVEVVKGPSAVLFGRGSTGGAINQVSKAPLLTPLDELTAEYGTNNLYRATADVDTPIAPGMAARLNLMRESSDVAERDLVHNGRWGVAPAIGFGLGGRDTFTLAYLHQQENDLPDVGVPFVDGRLPPVPRHAFYGLASDRATADDDIATARYVHSFSDDLTLADTLRYANYDFGNRFDAPNFGHSVPAPGQPLADILVGRDAPSSSGEQTNLDEQLDVTARLQTGPISHALVAGVEIARQSSRLERYTNPFNANNGWIPETPLPAPDPYERSPFEPIASQQETLAPSGGAYVIDTLSLGRVVSLTGGFRYDWFDARYRQLTFASGALLQLTERNRLGSPRAALLLSPTAHQSYYLSYGTSFDPSAEALTLTTRTANLGPVRARTYEAGAKSDWLGGRLLLTGALFRTEIDNAQTNDPDNPSITVLNGDQRVDGLELDASGYLTRHWELYGGYSYLDGRTLASGTAAYVGKVMPNVAHDSLNLWSEYELPAGWEIGGGANWLGKRFADSAEAANVPGYVVWNAMVSYTLSPHLQLQLNGLNLFNRRYYGGLYYTSAAENHAVPGAGRSMTLSARMSF